MYNYFLKQSQKQVKTIKGCYLKTCVSIFLQTKKVIDSQTYFPIFMF